jgi:uracil-DNA glycosylase family protein
MRRFRLFPRARAGTFRPLNRRPRRIDFVRVETMRWNPEFRMKTAISPDNAEFSVAPVPATRQLKLLRQAAASCRACPLWKNATCTVFGEGPKNAKIVFVGEQPGDQEDRAGKPFVGPAGVLLDRALAAAGVDRKIAYVTNAVKHFKWTPRGKRRLHAKPNAREMAACRPWLEAELHAIKPEKIVCLGATAARSVLGRPVKVTQMRGQFLPSEFAVDALVTLHPSSLLRLPPNVDREKEFARFVDDLRALKNANQK